MKSILVLLVFLAVTGLAAATGSLFRPGPWYAELAKPAWTPPNWLFPPVWTILYVMIAIAGWRVWKADGLGTLFWIWMIALVLNAAWSFLMFGQHQIGLAAIDIIALWVAIATFIFLAMPVDRLAGLLFIPYSVWVTYATALNITIYRMNV